MISFIFLLGCITSVNNEDGAKFIGYLDEDITYNKGEGFLIKDKGYKIITSKKGVRYVQLIDTHSGGIAVPINSKGCVEPKNSKKAYTADNSLLGGYLETRIAILMKKADSEDLEISFEIIEFIASSITENVRDLEGALIRLLAFASLKRQDINMILAKQVILDIMGTTAFQKISIEHVLKIVSKEMRITERQLIGKIRTTRTN